MHTTNCVKEESLHPSEYTHESHHKCMYTLTVTVNMYTGATVMLKKWHKISALFVVVV